jgi:hypothetical protein
MTTYVCTKGYYKLPDIGIILNSVYPFSLSREHNDNATTATADARHWSMSGVN